MAKRFGALLLGAAFFSMFMPSRRTQPAQPAQPAAPQLPKAGPRKRLWALVQVKPQVAVLAVSDSREDLEAELAEINETWNHWDLRTERQRYDIQPVCMLQTAKDTQVVPSRRSSDPALGR